MQTTNSPFRKGGPGKEVNLNKSPSIVKEYKFFRLKTVELNRVKAAIEYVDTNYAMPISTTFIAAEFGLWKGKFHSSFKSLTGLTFHNYLLKIRIDHAKKELADLSKEVRTIAQNCGFLRASHFNHQFRKLTGETPTQLRSKWMISIHVLIQHPIID